MGGKRLTTMLRTICNYHSIATRSALPLSRIGNRNWLKTPFRRYLVMGIDRVIRRQISISCESSIFRLDIVVIVMSRHLLSFRNDAPLVSLRGDAALISLRSDAALVSLRSDAALVSLRSDAALVSLRSDAALLCFGGDDPLDVKLRVDLHTCQHKRLWWNERGENLPRVVWQRLPALGLYR